MTVYAGHCAVNMSKLHAF